MKLYKSDNALKDKGIGKLNLKCDEDKDKWLNLIKILYNSNDLNAVIIKGLYDNKKDIVLKVGIKNAIDKEFEIATILKEFSGFIRYYCKFLCYDDIKKIIKNEDMINAYCLCKNGKNEIGILTMNYYKLGSIGSFNWNISNIDVLKNVLKQTVFAVLYAFEKIGFIHGDLHSDNILLKNKTVDDKNYGCKIISINTFEIRIMDFEKSKINKDLELKYVFDNVEKLLNSISVNDKLTVKFNYKNGMLRKMKNNSVNKTHYDDFESIIDSLYIEYVKNN
jgi:serine/threonine protein kinase